MGILRNKIKKAIETDNIKEALLILAEEIEEIREIKRVDADIPVEP